MNDTNEKYSNPVCSNSNHIHLYFKCKSCKKMIFIGPTKPPKERICDACIKLNNDSKLHTTL